MAVATKLRQTRGERNGAIAGLYAGRECRVAHAAISPTGSSHVVARGTARSPIFLDDHDRRLFLGLLARSGEAVGWERRAFCLMTNHYHLVVATTVECLSRGMHRLNGVYAQGFNERYGRTGHLFQSRYEAREIASDEQLGNVCRYVEANPVRAGLCQTAEGWPWGSAGAGAELSRP